MRFRGGALAVSFLLAAWLAAGSTSAQQFADSSFDTRVAKPAYPTKHPRLLFDEAHHNFHTSDGRYLTFAALARNDGYRVFPNHVRFSPLTLTGNHLLVIANALGHKDMGDPGAARPAFTDEECDAVRDWVRAGGALLLIADHAPMGAAASNLAARFGVEMRNGYTVDPAHMDSALGNPGCILFTRAGRTLGDHPITGGRDTTERIERVMSFTGQSLRGPEGSTSILVLSDTAEDLLVGLGQAGPDVPPEKRKSAAGRSQGLAFEYGRGRVVVMGEAGMLSAQLTESPEGRRFPMGMNYPGIENKQFVLNILRWLTHGVD